MAYTLEFEMSPDPTGGSSHTGTARFFLDVDGTTTDLGTRTSPPEAGNDGVYDWGARSIDVSSTFDPLARNVVVRWRYESGSDGPWIRNLRITDGVDEWLDQWGENGHWGSTHPWAAAGPGSSFWYDWEDFPNSLGDAFGDDHVHHLIRTQDSGAMLLEFEIAPDANATGGSGHISRAHFFLDVDGTTTDLGLAISRKETGNDGVHDWRTWLMNVEGLVDFGTALDVKVRWQWDTGPDTSYVRNMRFTDGVDEWLDQWGVAGHWDSVHAWGADGASTFVYDWCDFPSSLGDHFGDGFVHHVFRPVLGCAGWILGILV